MPDTPYHVVGGSFITPNHQANGFANLGRLKPPSDEITITSSSGSLRRKLWEVPHKFHCPVIGVCFGVDELRSLMAKVMHFPRDTTDFVLHTTAVGACESRSQLAELLHKNLEKRFKLTTRRFAASKNCESLRQLWREAARSGIDIPAALWASWTHPACDALLEQEIYGNIHMIQHQIGTGTRADLAMLKSLQADNIELRRQLTAARRELETQSTERARESQRLNQRITELQAEQAGKEALAANLTGQLSSLRDSLPDLKDRQSLLRRINDAESRAQALTARASVVEADANRLRELNRHADETIQHLLAAGESAADSPSGLADESPNSLTGKCILCVGGRSGTIDGYRQVVEQRGGRFLHHDGGLEESLHRIDAALSAADLVICQAGCISHNAYWRVKEQCKRTGKQCVFIKTAGVSSFDRAVSATCRGNATSLSE
jgi:hypothetical protein